MTVAPARSLAVPLLAARTRVRAVGDRAVLEAARVGASWALDPSVPWAERRRRSDLLTAAVPSAAGVQIGHEVIAGRVVERYEPRVGRRRGAVLYLHGGGFAVGSPRGHRPLVSRFCAATGLVVYSLGYRLAPEHPHPAPLEDAWSAYQHLCALEAQQASSDGGDPCVVIAGDSAGGTLSLTTAFRAIERGGVQPAALALICPVTDLTDDHAAQRPYSDREPLLTRERMDAFVSSYATERERRDPEASPLLASEGLLARLPRVVMDSCGDDPLRLDADALDGRLRSVGVPVDHVRHAARFHDFHLMAGWFPPGGRAIADLGQRLRVALADRASQSN